MAQTGEINLEETLRETSVDADTLHPVPGGLKYGVVIEPDQTVPAPAEAPERGGISWVVTVLILLFVAACLRYRKNARYFATLLGEILEVRERHNAFDDTVRESTFLWLLNLIWCASTGVVLYSAIGGGNGSPWAPGATADIFICMGVALGYTLFMWVAYYVTGSVFSSGAKAALWAKGYLAAQGLGALPMLAMAFLIIGVPALSHTWVIIGLICFIATKFIFIYKGFRIFFTQIASWVLFLYYLCSLEIIPIILTVVTAGYLCRH